MFRLIYNLLFPAAFLLLLPGYLRRMVRRGNYRRHFWQRLGWYALETRQRFTALQGTVWIQAVSVGEMLVALKLLAALRKQSPDLPVILSTTTTTGYTLAVEKAPANVPVIYSPVDLAGAVRRAFEAIQPAQLVVVDGGLWPNQLWEARRRQTPTSLVNARLSPRSERRFHRFPRLTAALYGLLDLVCVTEPADLPRWQSLGIAAAKLQHTGSVKFDEASPAAESREPIAPQFRFDGPILLAGSTHPHEERTLAETFLRLRTQFPDLLLIIAPRHVERTPEIAAELAALGLRVVLRTTLPTASLSAASPTVLLINTTGELRDWYALATLVFIGKSLHAVGGQNPAEAIAAGVPVICGPHMENFAELTTSLLYARAVVQVDSPAALEQPCARLLSDPAERQRLAAAAREQVARHRGAAARTAALLLEQLRNSACQGE